MEEMVEKIQRLKTEENFFLKWRGRSSRSWEVEVQEWK